MNIVLKYIRNKNNNNNYCTNTVQKNHKFFLF